MKHYSVVLAEALSRSPPGDAKVQFLPTVQPRRSGRPAAVTTPAVSTAELVSVAADHAGWAHPVTRLTALSWAFEPVRACGVSGRG